LFGGQAHSLKARLGTVAARGGKDKLMAQVAAAEEEPQ
jgi:hypothetical protein